MTGSSIERFFERVMVAAGGCVLIAAAAALDDRVRERTTGVFAGSAMSELSAAGTQVERALRQAAEIVGYQSSEHGMLAFFVVAATILFFVMFRT